MEKCGEAIPGSELFRAFCAICRTPIRVPDSKRFLQRNDCVHCMLNEIGIHPTVGTTHPATPRSEREYDGGKFQRGDW